jgi:hypothetical protein
MQLVDSEVKRALSILLIIGSIQFLVLARAKHFQC